MFTNKPLVDYDNRKGSHPLLKTAGLAAGGAAFVVGHRHLMADPGFAGRVHSFFERMEELSPNRILRTFRLSDLYSSYVPTTLDIARNQLFSPTGNLTHMGEHLQRMLGSAFDLSTVGEKGLSFVKDPRGTSFMRMVGREDIGVRFFKGRQGRLFEPSIIAASSQRLGAGLNPPKNPISSIAQSISLLPSRKSIGTRQWLVAASREIRDAQLPQAVYREAIHGFQPGAVRVEGRALLDTAAAVERIGFTLGERAQTLLADIHLGLWQGSYDKLFHMPFVGEGGLINELLTKRALPIYAGVVGLGFLDYLTGHAVSNTAIDLFQQTNVFKAKLTDKVPGARAITDFYEKTVPGPQYGPAALPLLGLTAGAMYHYAKVISGQLAGAERLASARIFEEDSKKAFAWFFNKESPIAKGLVFGLAAMIPFIPGMLGSRKTARELQDIYSGDEPVPIRAGRWWDLGTTPWEGNRIKEYRAHWTVLHKAQAEKVSLYGSEKEYWKHHPLLHPLRWLRDPYYLEKLHYADRPYPITSPAFSNVPLVGPLLAATIGKVFKPPVRMHPEWNPADYDIGSSRIQPKGPDALPPAVPQPEFGLKDMAKREILSFSDLIGLPGFIARTIYGRVYPGEKGRDVYLQGSRAMENVSRRYYEKELGAGLGPNADISGPLGYTEPLRRFIQPEPQRFTANEIPNTMPSWLPGKDYFMNFRTGDPYTAIPEGYARLPGAGYEALHPELTGVNPEDYPDITKMSILGDVAPYSVEYRRMAARVRRDAINDINLRIEYDKIEDRVKKMRDSVVRTEDRRFSREVVESHATVSRITSAGIELEEFPGREFQLSSVGYSAADMSAAVLAEHNDWTKEQIGQEVANRRGQLGEFFQNYLAPGTPVTITTAAGALESQPEVQAVFQTDQGNVNKTLISEGYGIYRKDLGGPESQAMFGFLGRALGNVAEQASFTGDEARWNPLRYLPSPFHTKYWQNRTPLAQYQQQEVEGARMRRWQHPLEDFVMPYLRGAYRRVAGGTLVPDITAEKWNLNTMTDMLDYIRDMQLASANPEEHGRYTSQASRTAIGANLFGNPTFVASTLGGRDATYFERFLAESDPNERKKILSTVPAEMAKALSAQWVAREASIARAEGRNVPEIGEGGRLYTDPGLAEYAKADTKLNYGDYQRSREIASFFVSHGLSLPESSSSPLYNPNIDYEDVKLKIIQNEGYDAHDFGIFDDRAALLWRKPYVDGAIRELTGPDRRSVEEVRRSVEEMIVAAHDKNPKVVVTSSSALRSRGNVRVDVDVDRQDELLKDMRRNPERYQ